MPFFGDPGRVGEVLGSEGTMSYGCSPFSPWVPGTGTEQPGWVVPLGNVPLSCLDLQSQLHLRQKMGNRGLSQLGEQ